MLKNYFKTAWRNLSANKLYSFINITGLTVGLAACLLVASVVLNDLSYDKQWSNSNNIYRIISENNINTGEVKSASTFSGLGPALQKNFPEVIGYCRMGVNKQRLRLDKDVDGVSVQVLSAEPSVWNFLDFTVLQGTPKQFVKGYKNLVISEELQQAYFGSTNAVGKIITSISSFGAPVQYLITGVIKNIPSNTHFAADALLVNDNEHNDAYNELNGEYGTFATQYILTRRGTNMQRFTAKINNWYSKDIVKKKPDYSYSFQPLKNVYLYSPFSESVNTGSIQNVYIFSGVALLLLIIACVNFINLTTARVVKRIKETGIRKVLGAGKGQLIMQFLAESLLFFMISFVFAIILYSASLHSVEVFLGHTIVLSFLHSIGLIAATSGVVLLVSLFTGLYPAWLLSKPQPVDTLKGNMANYGSANFFRKALVTVQFTISMIVLSAAVIVQYQLHYLNDKDLGFNRNNIFKTDFTSWDGRGEAFKNAVQALPGVEHVTISGWAPSLGGGSMSSQVDDPLHPGSKITVWSILCSVDLAATLQLQLEKGRWLSANMPTDAPDTDSMGFAVYEKFMKKQPVLITEYTARFFNVTELNKYNKYIEGIPVGIIKDFNNESLQTPMRPCIIRATSSYAYGYMMVKVKPGATQQFLKDYNNLWHSFYPQKLLQFDWVDNLLAAQYRKEQKLQQLFTFFSCLTIALACLGLFGLTAFTAEQRTKEIGIRKVLGATVSGITAMLSARFFKLVFIAIIVALPVAGWLMFKWLQQYAYRISISWWMFAFAAIVLMLITLITISFQSIKVAVANPIKSLRSE